MPPVPGRAQEESQQAAVGKTYPAVEETYPAVEETYPAVVSFFHGIFFLSARAPFSRPAAPSKIDAT